MARTMTDFRMDAIERAVDAGAAALVKGGVVTDHVTGDVLNDHDWTPMEAARVVLEAANYAGAVEALSLCVDRLVHGELPGNADWWEKARPFVRPEAASRVARLRGGQ